MKVNTEWNSQKTGEGKRGVFLKKLMKKKKYVENKKATHLDCLFKIWIKINRLSVCFHRVLIEPRSTV